MIDKGKIILGGALNEIKARYGRKNASINYEGDISFLRENPIIEKIEDYGNTTSIRVKDPEQTQDLLKLLVDRKVKIKKFDANEISLQEIFVELAGRDVNGFEREVNHV